jgi:soluble lytic murein transglycosylase-like protein
MYTSRSEPDEEYFESRQTVPTGGCLSGFLIPPMVVLCFGMLLILATRNLTVSGAQPAQVQSQIEAQPQTQDQAPASLTTGNGSGEHSLDPNLAATVMQIESCGNPDARSGAGAAGLFQVMPFHFFVYENAYDPDVNALRGLNYLAKSLQTAGGDSRLALAGYNGGIGLIGRAESSWPAETQRYAYWAGIYDDAVQNASESTRLNEWLAAGGASLCRKARERLGIVQ